MSALKYNEKQKENCIDLYKKGHGYRMWISCKPENLIQLKNYVSTKFSTIPLLNEYKDAFDFNSQLPRQYKDKSYNFI